MISQELIAKQRREGMRWNIINTLNKARPHTTSETFLLDIMNAIYPQTTATELRQQATLEIAAAHEQAAQEDSDAHEATRERIREMQEQAQVQAQEAEERLQEALSRAEEVRARTDAEARKRQEEAVTQAEETLAQARIEAEQIISDARADADVTAQVAARQLQELERQRDSVAAYLTEMRGVLGGALPQAPTFSDHVAALPQEPSPAPAAEQSSAQSAEPAASSSASSARSAARISGRCRNTSTSPITDKRSISISECRPAACMAAPPTPLKRA